MAMLSKVLFFCVDLFGSETTQIDKLEKYLFGIF